MYRAILEIDNKRFVGTLDMYVLKKIQEDLSKLDIETSIPNIFLKISKLDMKYISSFVINSINRINEEQVEDFLSSYLEEVDEAKLLERFNSIYTYINDIFEKCLPKQEKKSESIFADDDLLYEDLDWEFDYMEYTWNCLISRGDDFWSITPKNYFEQLNIYKKFNNIKDENEEMEMF